MCVPFFQHQIDNQSENPVAKRKIVPKSGTVPKTTKEDSLSLKTLFPIRKQDISFWKLIFSEEKSYRSENSSFILNPITYVNKPGPAQVGAISKAQK